jgi:quercetin dioxygenase-like cupin family protein
MRIFRSSDAAVGPVDPATFRGHATVQRLAHEESGVPVGVDRVAFSDGGRTNWHRHSGPQWLFVIEGRVRVQAEGGDFQDLDAGDAVVIAPGERHWHGAAPGRAGTHIAVNINAATTWLEPVSDEEYGVGDLTP